MKKSLALVLGILAAGPMLCFAQENDNDRPQRRGPRDGAPRDPVAVPPPKT